MYKPWTNFKLKTKPNANPCVNQTQTDPFIYENRSDVSLWLWIDTSEKSKIENMIKNNKFFPGVLKPLENECCSWKYASSNVQLRACDGFYENVWPALGISSSKIL